ncbi:MAG: ATP phosphoribosyltransferase regulatory subunit [Pseudomonadota bacterium]
MQKNSSFLLPNGLNDLLFPAAENEAAIIQNCMNVFSSFSYNRVKPPLIEFEESLLAPGPGKTLAEKTFRMMDPVSGKMLGVRADTTAQIARIAKSRFEDSAKPLRLSYAADILRVKASQLRPDRQFCQVGCELIGARDAKDDVEVMLIALKSLRACNLKNLSVDLTVPNLVDALFDSEKMSVEEREKANQILLKRDRDGLNTLSNKKIISYLSALLDASGLAEQAVAALKKIKTPRASKESIQNILSVYEELKKALEAFDLQDVKVTIDLVERRGLEYKTGVGFTLFSKDIRGELGRGGRYYLDNTQDHVATGFTLYMDSMIQSFKSNASEEIQIVSQNTDWEKIKDYQKQGLTVLRE